MFVPSYSKDVVIDFHVLPPSYGLCYSWELCVSIHTYDNREAGELIATSKYLIIMKANINCYWKQLGSKESVIIATCIIFHPCLDVSTIKYVTDIPRTLLKKAHLPLQRHLICVSDSDHDDTLYIIELQNKNEYKIK